MPSRRRFRKKSTASIPRALAALRERFGIDIAELAAIRAFAKVVDPEELSAEFAVLMAARGRLSSASGIGCCGRSAFVPNSCVPKPGRAIRTGLAGSAAVAGLL